MAFRRYYNPSTVAPAFPSSIGHRVGIPNPGQNLTVRPITSLGSSPTTTKQVPASYTPTSGITLATQKPLTLSQYTTKKKFATTPNLSVTPTGSIIGTPTAAQSFVRSYKSKTVQPSKTTYPILYPGAPTHFTPPSSYLVTPSHYTATSPIQPHYTPGGGGAPSGTPNPPIVTPYTRSPYTVQAPTPLVVTRTTAPASTSSSKTWWLIGAVVAVGGGLYLWYRHKKQQGSEAFQ